MSVRDKIAARREAKKKQDYHLDYEVPGYSPEEGAPSDLVIRFDPADYEYIHRYQTAAGDPEAELDVDLDVIVNSCREILVREESGELAPYVKGEATTFADVDEAMGFESETARQNVLEVFPSKNAVSECAGQLVIWTRTVDYKVDDELAGESGPGTTESSSSPGKPQSSD